MRFTEKGYVTIIYSKMIFFRLLQLRGWLSATPNLSTSSSTSMFLYFATCATVLMCLTIGVTCLETKDNNNLEDMTENEETTHVPENGYVDLMRTEGFIVEEEPVDEYTRSQLDGFHYFRNVQQHKIKKDFPDWNLAEIEREVVEIWNNAGDETQIKYVNDVVTELEQENEQHLNNPEPRGLMSAYAFFVQDYRQEMSKEHPGEGIEFKEFSKNCALRWSTMSDKEMYRYQEMVIKDQQKYDARIQKYTSSQTENDTGRGIRQECKKDPSAPKRSLSAFFLWSLGERSKVRELYPEYGIGDIARALSKRWIAIDSETKSKYEAKAAEDDARYEREMTEYIKKLEGDDTLSEKEKICYHEMAATAQHGSNVGIQNNPPPTGENEIGRDMEREYNKDRTSPKRPLSAFSWWSLDDRGKVEELHPEYTEEDIIKELDKRWTAADSITKSEYEAKAAEDDTRYKREMNEYKMTWKRDAYSITLPPIIIRHPIKEDAEEKDDAKSDK